MNNIKKDIVIPFSKGFEYGIEDIGYKALNICHLVSQRMPVPNGFVITTQAFLEHFYQHKLNEFIAKEIINIEPSDSVRLENVSKRIRSTILKIDIKNDMKKVFGKGYSALSGFSDTYVAVRSSPTIETFKQDYLSGQYSTFLNIKGKADLIERIKYCWSSLYTPQNLFYILSKGYDINTIGMAVIVQKMIQAEVSGILFTINPIDNNKNDMNIECILGLGEALVTGQLNPDTYILKKENGEIEEKRIVPQEWMLVRKGRVKKGEDPNIKVKISDVWKVRQKLESKYISKLYKLGLKVEEYFKNPQEIEWTYEGGRIWIVQSRTITTLKLEEDSWKTTPTFAALKSKVEDAKTQRPVASKSEVKVVQEIKQKVISAKEKPSELLQGIGTNGGFVTGVVKIVNDLQDINKIKDSCIIVAQRISAEFEGKLKNALGIIVDNRNKDSYETIMAKSMDIPCIVDTNFATKVLRNNEIITLDGDKGRVYSGAVQNELLKTGNNTTKDKEKDEDKIESVSKEIKTEVEPKDQIIKKTLKTATKIYANINESDSAPKLATEDYDGVSKINIENTIMKFGLHPKLTLQSKKDKENFINTLSLSLFRVAKSFDPRPVIYRISNLSTLDYADLTKGNEYETGETNPMIGYRGTSRFMVETEELELELEAVRNIRNKENIKNIWIAIPFVRNLNEYKEMKQIISSFGFRRSSTLKLFLMVQVPSVALQIEQFIEMGLDGVIIDLDFLSQLIMGVDRTNPKLLTVYEKIDSSILWLLERIIKTCSKYKVHTQVTSDNLLVNPILIKKLIKFGVSSIAMESEYLDETRKMVYEAEKDLITKRK